MSCDQSNLGTAETGGMARQTGAKKGRSGNGQRRMAIASLLVFIKGEITILVGGPFSRWHCQFIWFHSMMRCLYEVFSLPIMVKCLLESPFALRKSLLIVKPVSRVHMASKQKNHFFRLIYTFCNFYLVPWKALLYIRLSQHVSSCFLREAITAETAREL